jgi:2,4-dienoyl-CoA reductase-like NADH-dependent reductase (Old Yellow Enzyme family)
VTAATVSDLDPAPLFEPFRAGQLSLPNRLVMAPMTRSFSPGGVPGPDVAAYYRRRVEGGIGLIITEGTWIAHPTASNEANVPRFHGEDALAGWRAVLAAVWHQTNKRTDRLGGDRRARVQFGVDMIRACRARVSPGFPIVLRFSQWKLQDYNARLAETPQQLEAFLTPLADAGVDLFHASQRRFWQPEFAGSGLNLAGWAKKLTGKPSISVGSVGLEKEMLESMVPENTGFARIDRAIEMVAHGEVDLVAVGRALLSDPDWPRKVRQRDHAAIRPFNPAVLAALT